MSNYANISTAPIWQLGADAITGFSDGATLMGAWPATVGPSPTASGSPIFHTSGPNGHAYVNLTSPALYSTSALASSSGSYDIFGVARVPDTTGRHWLVDVSSGRLAITLWEAPAASYLGYLTNAGGTAISNVASSVHAGAWTIFEFKLNGTGSTGTVYVNGVAVGAGAYSTTNIGGSTVVGEASDAPSVTQGLGDVAALIVYGSVLSDTDRGAVGAALATTYGIASTYGIVTIAPDDAGIFYSPYNWLVTAAGAKTINAGAYFKTIINASASCKINFTVSSATPYSQFVARLDGGAWQQCTPTSAGLQTFVLTMPTGTTATRHLMEVVVKSTTETQDRWNAQGTAVTFTGLTLDAGASVSLPALRKYRALIFGDSITESVRVNGYTGIANDTDRNDALAGWALKLGDLSDAEAGIVGFGATGLTVAGSGNVPALTTSYANLWSGQARSFSPVPDLVILNEGANENGVNVTAALATVVNGIIAAIGAPATTFSGLPATRFVVLRPFGGQNAANLQAAVAALGNPNVTYGDTTGFFNGADSSDNLHPYAYADLGFIAPQVAALASATFNAGIAGMAVAVGSKSGFSF